MDKEVGEVNRKLNASIGRIIGLFTLVVTALLFLSIGFDSRDLIKDGFSLKEVLIGDLSPTRYLTVRQGSTLIYFVRK